MTQEEKARAYDEALERAKKEWNDNLDNAYSNYREHLEIIFPELKENEDERIREAQLDYWRSVGGKEWHGVPVQEAIAWLEKQGQTFTQKDVDDAYLKGVSDTKHELEKQEEKPQGKTALEAWKDMRLEVYQQASGNRHEPNCSDDTTKMFSLNNIDEIIEKISEQKSDNKIEPKFKVENGKWYICTQTFVLRGKIVVIKGQIYQAQENGAIKGEEGRLFVDKHDGKASEYFRLWTIQDARDGDVLLSKYNQPFIYNGIFDEDSVGAYCGIDKLGNDFLQDTFSCEWSYKEGVKPATKEQRDTLFAKMKEAGYEWDAEKKELKKIEEEYNGEDYGIDSLFHAQRILEKTLGEVEGYQSDDGILEHKCAISAVKKLCGQKPAWSEEDENFFANICSIIDADRNFTESAKRRCKDWLKSLKQKIGE